MKIVLTCFGSLGDVNPYLAIAKELQVRGHSPLIAGDEVFRKHITTEGIAFHSVRPDCTPFMNSTEFFRKGMDKKEGLSFILSSILFPSLRGMYEDSRAALEGADLVVTHQLSFGAHLALEQTNTPWVSTVLAPAGFVSTYDFPVMGEMPAIKYLRHLGPGAMRTLLGQAKKRFDLQLEPYYAFRKELGLPHGKNPLMEGHHSPTKVLGLFSPLLAKVQPDYPSNTTVTGFCPFDGFEGSEMPAELEAFLSKGGAPLVFSLGSAAVNCAEGFFDRSIEVVKRVQRRAVFLVGKNSDVYPQKPLGKNIIAVPYAPYSKLFPRACAIIASGGIGTVSQIMASGKPCLILPFAHDQYDNADRLCRLGVGRSLQMEGYTPLHGAAEILRLVGENLYPSRAKEVAELIAQEQGTKIACDEIEATLGKRR